MFARIFLIGSLLLTGFWGVGQEFSLEVFHDGLLVSSDGDTLRGQIKYDMENNIVQLVKNDIVKTFSSHSVFYFEIFDKLRNNFRQFYSIPYKVKYDYEVPILFEVLYEGPMSLLCREAIVHETVNSGFNYGYATTYVQKRLQLTFYFLEKNGRIQFFQGKKSDLYFIMSKKSSKVKEYIKKNNLKVDEVKDLIRITAFYNAL